MITETQLTALRCIKEDVNFSPGKLAKILWEHSHTQRKRFGRNMRAGRIIQSLITAGYARKLSSKRTSQLFVTEQGEKTLQLASVNIEVQP